MKFADRQLTRYYRIRDRANLVLRIVLCSTGLQSFSRMQQILRGIPGEMPALESTVRPSRIHAVHGPNSIVNLERAMGTVPVLRRRSE